MTVVYHLTVGDADFTPTPEQLMEIVMEFQKPLPGFAVPVQVTELHLDLVGEQRLMFTAGSPEWDPTEKEIENLKSLFLNASLDPNGGVVATRLGVKASVIPKWELPEASK